MLVRSIGAAGLAALLAVGSLGAQPKPADPFAGLDDWIRTAMAEHQVPGLALGVVKDGKVVTARAFGYRNVEERLPVTPRTVMAIGSGTKSFTALLMGMLVDEKRVAWDQPIRTWLPDFRLQDEYATEHLTPRDLLTHRSGLPAHNGIWYGRRVTEEHLYQRLRYLEPSTSLRNRFQYNNLMYMVAGYLQERVTGMSWHRLVRERILDPLGMSRASTTIAEMEREDDFAYPYRYLDGKVTRIPYRSLDPIPAAGAINASVEDMLKYLQFRIDRTTPDGRRLASNAVLDAAESPQMAMGSNEQYEYPAYGFGAYVITYRGHPMVHHSGGIDGFASHLSWLPKDRLGVIVLTNKSGDNLLPGLIHLELVDRVLGLERTDRLTLLRKVTADGRAASAAAEEKHRADRVAGAGPSRELAAYAGRYRHPAYGTLDVRERDGRLEIVFDDFVVPLEHYHYDVFDVDDRKAPAPFSGPVTFRLSAKGEVAALLIPFERSVPDIVFEAQPRDR